MPWHKSTEPQCVVVYLSTKCFPVVNQVGHGVLLLNSQAVAWFLLSCWCTGFNYSNEPCHGTPSDPWMIPAWSLIGCLFGVWWEVFFIECGCLDTGAQWENDVVPLSTAWVVWIWRPENGTPKSTICLLIHFALRSVALIVLLNAAHWLASPLFLTPFCFLLYKQVLFKICFLCQH